MSRRNDAPEKASRPFDLERDGFILGEGAGVLILEELEHARKRGAVIYAEVLGLGSSFDAYAATKPDPEARGAARAIKESLREAMVQDYVLLARLKGKSELRLVLEEALRNAVAPTLALTGVQFTFLLGGTVIVERIFAYPGIGNMAIDAVINRDFPLIQGLVLTFAVMFIALNLIVDFVVALLDPRLRHG